MGFTSRSISIFRYRVKGELEGSFWDAVDDGVKKGAYKEYESGDVVAIGWTSIEDFTDSEFQRSSYAYGSYVALGLRIDTIRVPSKILEVHFKAESRKLLQETGRRRLSNAQSREIKEALRERLKQSMLPSIQVFEMMWHTNEGIVYFGSHSIKARERFEDHFKKSFGLNLRPLIPYVRAQELLDTTSQKLLEDVQPCIMVP